MATCIINRLPNSEIIAAAVRANDGYCPCKVLKTPESLCMCEDFREQFKGVCECGLYEKIPADFVLYTKDGCPLSNILKNAIKNAGKVYVESQDYPDDVDKLPTLLTPTGVLYDFTDAMRLICDIRGEK